jgi:hypothetical protein
VRLKPVTGGARNPPDDERIKRAADVLVELKDVVFQHMASHTMAAVSPSWRRRRDAKRASRKEFSEMLDAIKLLGPDEREARLLSLAAYEEASAANPPVTGVESLDVVADDAWLRIFRGLHERGYLDADELGPVVDAELRERHEILARRAKFQDDADRLLEATGGVDELRRELRAAGADELRRQQAADREELRDGEGHN